MTTAVTCLAPSDTFDYTSIFNDMCRDRGLDVTFDGYRPHRGELPSTVGDLLLITGSAFHVYDREDWVADAGTLIRDAVADGTPVFGVCYGHQLVADALGGTVAAMDQREMGYRRIRLTDEGAAHPLFAGFDSPFITFTSHKDAVTRLPDDAVALAENGYGNHAFAHTELPAWGIQFHPEYDLQMAEDLLAQKSLPQDKHDDIAATLTAENAAAAAASRRVFDNLFTHLL